jgi:putative peptidoglycan lipid II flippase
MGQVLLQLPSLYREGYRHHLNLNLSDPGLRKILSLMGPGTFAGAGVQINLLVNMILATGQGSGAVSWLGYAFRIMYLPIGLFGISIASATLPVVSRHAARKEFDDIRNVVSRALRLMLVANLPAMFGLIALAEPIVSLIFERGNFTAEDSSATAAALLFYAPGLIGYSAVRIAVPCFYALGNSLVPAYISMASVILNVGLNLFLVELMGYRGLALGTSVTALANAVTLLAFLQYRLNGLDLRRVLLVFTKISAASTVMAISAWSTNEFLSNYWPGLALAVEILRLSISIVVGITVLIAVSLLLRIEELAQMWQQLRTRIRRSD